MGQIKRLFNNYMGNYCCERENNLSLLERSRKRRVSTESTKTRQLNNPEEQFPDSLEILQMLNSNDRVSMRPNFPPVIHFHVVQELGKGAQAQVYKVNVQTQDPKQRYSLSGKKSTMAIKRINIKDQKKNRRSIQLAKSLLIQNDCPFLVKGFFICQSDKYIYEGMNLAQGGDLSSFLENTTGKGDAFRKLGEEGMKLIIAGIILGIEYLHRNGFIYCDLKTDNILVGLDGFPMLADFELTKNQISIPTSEFQGTLTGVGPEVQTQEFFDRGIDLWALGILIYTLVYGETPYCVQQIVSVDYPKQCQTKENNYKLKRKKVSEELIDLIHKLLRVKPSQRIGYKSVQQIKQHKFFKEFNWEEYSQKKMKNPVSQIVKRYSTSCWATYSPSQRLYQSP